MNLEHIFTAADRNKLLSADEFVELSDTIQGLLQGIKTQTVRAFLKPTATSYPGYRLLQDEFTKEQVSTGQNRSNSIKELLPNVTPLRFYHMTEASLVMGLVDDLSNLASLEIPGLRSEHSIPDPSGRSPKMFVNIAPDNITSLSIASLELETAAKARTANLFEENGRAVDISVKFYSPIRWANAGSELAIVFDFSIM